jgi:hypothetical protein
MKAPLIIPALLLLIDSIVHAQTVRRTTDLPTFMDRAVTVTEPIPDADGYYAKGSASICLEGPPQRQCYSAPDLYGHVAKVQLVEVQKGLSVLLFEAESVGTSGYGIHVAFLRPGHGKDLDNLLLSDITLSNQSQFSFWNDASVSPAKAFVTAEFDWGPDEGHYGDHRYIISAYVLKPTTLAGGPSYHLYNQYMTVHKYDLEKSDVLVAEKPEIIARLRRVKAAANPNQRVPRPK